MAVSFNSVLGFHSTANYQQLSRSASQQKVQHFTCPSQMLGSRRHLSVTRSNFNLLVANSDRVGTEISDKDVTNAESSYSENNTPNVNKPSSESSETKDQVQVSGQTELTEKESEVSNASATPNTPKPTLKRSPLTAREKLRAARVLSRYNESKATKPELGSKLIEALRESEKGKKRPGLPEAPSNMLDDSKRGMPKPGWTFELPGGFDVFLIAFSFVFISTVMFATTFIVWKLGAIHFNEN